MSITNIGEFMSTVLNAGSVSQNCTHVAKQIKIYTVIMSIMSKLKEIKSNNFLPVAI